MQQKLAKVQESCPDPDKDDDMETASKVSDNSVSMVTEKCVPDTTSIVNESLDKKVNYESSQENLNQHVSEGKWSLSLTLYLVVIEIPITGK